MSYELSPFPPALFEARNVFRKADKPYLAQSVIMEGMPFEILCRKQDATSSTEVRSFTECLGSLESAMDELHSCVLILLSDIMVQAQSLCLTVTRKGRLLKTSHIREDGTIFIHWSALLLKA